MLYVVHPSNELHKEKIKELWKTSFGDEDEYIEFFLNNRASRENTLILVDDSDAQERIASVLFLFDCQTRTGEKIYKTAYLYAACTHPDYRNKGCMGALLESAKKQCEQRNYSFISLVPASDSLFNYYQRFGYKDAFKERVFNLKREDVKRLSSDDFTLCELSAEDMLNVRTQMLDNKDALLWDKKALQYALDENKECEYDCLAIKNENGCAGYAFYYIEDDNLIVRECAFIPDEFSTLLGALLKAADFKKLSIKTPVFFNTDAKSKVRFNGMILAVNDQMHEEIKNITNACLGHTLG